MLCQVPTPEEWDLLQTLHKERFDGNDGFPVR
jgi:hypothetical protein